jgi:hypothetical protein
METFLKVDNAVRVVDYWERCHAESDVIVIFKDFDLVEIIVDDYSPLDIEEAIDLVKYAIYSARL